MMPGPLQILIVVLLILLVFGATRVPMIAENLAKGIKSFRKGLKDEDETESENSRISESRNRRISESQNSGISESRKNDRS